MNPTDFSIFQYRVPEKWYEGLYRDRIQPCSAARSFSLLHQERSPQCWLLLHGYRGYPGEFIRPAVDLYNAGFDVYVPRFPGHGTSGDDFINSRPSDWIGIARRAAADLKTIYSKVNVIGHSMGSAIAAVACHGDAEIGKIIYASPSFENTMLPAFNRLKLRLISPFVKKLRCPWQQDGRFHLHYEGDHEDDLYMGAQYWSWHFPKHLLDYYRISRAGLKAVTSSNHKHLLICPETDRAISMASLDQYREILADEANYVIIPDATHFPFYDINPDAEEAAVKAVLDFALE